jgi:hypothetical protein
LKWAYLYFSRGSRRCSWCILSLHSVVLVRGKKMGTTT